MRFRIGDASPARASCTSDAPISTSSGSTAKSAPISAVRRATAGSIAVTELVRRASSPRPPVCSTRGADCSPRAAVLCTRVAINAPSPITPAPRRSGMVGSGVNERIAMNPASIHSDLGLPTSCFGISSPSVRPRPARATTKPAAMAITNAGICAARPSPIVSTVKA